MRVKSLLAVFLSAMLLTPAFTASADNRAKTYRRALELYDNGMYERARTIFESLSDDPLSAGYSVLCALKMRTDDYPALLEAYDKKYPASSLTAKIHYEYALRLFDQDNYADAAAELAKVPERTVAPEDRAEYVFKKGYCAFAMGSYPEAINHFARVDAMSLNNFSAPARYLNGIMNYNGKSFPEAVKWFKLAQTDPRFTDLCDFYLVDSEFNMKNYDYVVSDGVRIFNSVPQERKERLARIISESYLVKGENELAKQYYESSYTTNMTRSDLFYAGSVLYAVEDYEGAIGSFSKMPERIDSLGQIANYQLGNAYVRTRNKVAAMDAFRDAANVSHDPEITEDALFNYAKLAFDLNKDTGGFARYIKEYSTKERGEQIYGYMALAALVDRDYASAVEAYDNIEELDGDMRNNYVKANYLRAEQLVANGSWKDAIPFLRATSYYLPKTDRFNQLARYWLAESYYRTDSFDEAGRTFADLYNGAALQGLVEGQILAYNAGYSYLQGKDYESAARWFDSYIRGGDRLCREDAMLRRADCDFVRRQYKDAISSYQKVIDEFGSADNVYPYYRQGLAYGLSGDKKKKVAVLKQVEDASPLADYYNEALYELGRAYMDQKSNSEAIRVFNELRDKSGDDSYVARALIGLGMVNRNTKDYDRALDCYKQVVKMLPGSEYAEDALLAIESIYTTRKQPEKYLEYMEANSLNSGKTDAEKDQMYFGAVEQAYLAGNWQQVVSSSAKYLQNYPEGASVTKTHFYLAEAYKEIGDKEKAVENYARAASAAGDGDSFSELARRGYAELSYDLERFKDAFAGYSALLNSARLEDNKAVARTGMMRSAYRAKDYDMAIAAADVVKENKPGDVLKREADYITAKSYMATSRRDEAMSIFSRLAAYPSTDEGAEAAWMLIQDTEDKGKFDAVEGMVYDFAGKAGNQSYWLAKAFITLGDSFAERANYTQAKATFESVRDGYTPSSATDDVLDNVNMRLERLAILMNR